MYLYLFDILPFKEPEFMLFFGFINNIMEQRYSL